MKRGASRSDVQQEAEKEAVALLGERLGCQLDQRKFSHQGIQITVDGYAELATRIILVDAWAHIGKAKPAQSNKVKADVLKLALLAKVLREEHPDHTVEGYILFVDDEASRVLRGRSWAGLAAVEFGIMPEVVALSPETVQAILDAQKVQNLLYLDNVGE